MKTTIKIAATLIAIIAIASLLGLVTAINNLKTWCDRYVAISMLSTVPNPIVITTVHTMGKAIAPRAISIAIKSDRLNYAAMTIRELKALCKGTGIKGWWNMTKPALVEALSAM